MYKTEETFYIIPKSEWYKIRTNDFKEFKEKFEDYKLKECTETKINEAIDTYNLEDERKFFNRLKAEHFYFCRVIEFKIGKYKSGKIELLDMWKK